MTTRAAVQTAFQIILAAIYYATIGQGPNSVYINWEEHRPLHAIQEYQKYFQAQREYQEKEYLLHHFNLGVHLLFAAEEYTRTIYSGPLSHGTMTGTITGDMYKVAKEVAHLSDYHAKAAVRLWLIFSENQEVLHRITQVSVAQFVHLKEEEVGHLYEVVNEQNLDWCPYCQEDQEDTTTDEEGDLFIFPMSPEPTPTPSEATTYLPTVEEVLTHPPYANTPDGYITVEDHEPFRFVPNVTVIDMEETLKEFDPYYDSEYGDHDDDDEEGGWGDEF